MPNLHKKAVAVLFLAIMIIVGIPTMFHTGGGFARSLFARLVKVNTAAESPQSTTAMGDVTQESPANLPKYPPPYFNKKQKSA